MRFLFTSCDLTICLSMWAPISGPGQLNEGRSIRNVGEQNLGPGGIFRHVVTDLEIRAQKYLEKLKLGDAAANSWFMRESRLGLEHRPRGLEALARSSFGNTAHLWMWDERSMTAALEKAGFI